MGTDPLSQLSLRAADSQAGEATEGALVPYSVVHVLPPLKSVLVVGPIDEEGQVFRSRYRPPPAQSPLLVRLGVVEDLNPHRWDTTSTSSTRMAQVRRPPPASSHSSTRRPGFEDSATSRSSIERSSR